MIHLFQLKKQPSLILSGWNWISYGQKQITSQSTLLLFHRQEVGMVQFVISCTYPMLQKCVTASHFLRFPKMQYVPIQQKTFPNYPLCRVVGAVSALDYIDLKVSGSKPFSCRRVVSLDKKRNSMLSLSTQVYRQMGRNALYCFMLQF